MNIFKRKFVIWALILTFVVEPFLLVPQITKGQDSGNSPTTEEQKEIDEPPVSDEDKAATGDYENNDPSQYQTSNTYSSDPTARAASEMNKIVYPDFSKSSSVLSLEEQLVGINETKLILRPNDMAALRALYYIGENIPDFRNDMHELWNVLPAEKRPESEEALLKLKIENPTDFNKLVDEARKIWTTNEDGKKLRTVKALSIITGLPENEIQKMSDDDRNELYNSMFESLKIDLRVLKTLIYLITPKNQGGAGHWRLKVRKIMQFTGKPLSVESDQVLMSLAGQNSSTPPTNCEGMTAAECGQQRRETEQENNEPDVTAEDENGDEWAGYIETKDDKGKVVSVVDTEEDALSQRNISAHTTGQALDISEVDDIRCTLVKKRRLARDSYLPQPARPIKLAWQTNEGYSQSGGNPIDMMGIMRAALNDDMQELVSSLGGDVTGYDGDLSAANLSDIVGIVGKSLFAQIINSPSHNLSGYDASETLQNLGSMYFADYFGLPREIFIGRRFDSIDDIEEIIGEAAIEKRLSLPYGSLNSRNFIKTLENQESGDPKLKNKTVYDLEGTYLNLGQRKLEYEMNLRPGDLDSYISGDGVSAASGQDLDTLIGIRVIEKELNLKKDTFAGADFKAIKKLVGDVKAALLFKDPVYLDNLLHLEPGTSKELFANKKTFTPTDFAKKVGETRKTDTLNGLRYFAANDAAYSLPEGTWEGMLTGKKAAFSIAGSHTLGRLIGDNVSYSKYLNQTPEVQAAIDSGELQVEVKPDDLGLAATQKWLNDNLTKSEQSDENACKKPKDEIKLLIPADVKYTLTPVGGSGRTERQANTLLAAPANETKNLEIPLGEEKAKSIGLNQDDLFNMFGCAEANTKWVFERIGSKLLYYGIANKLLNKDEKIKIDLMDSDPEVKTDNPQINFYLDRIKAIKNLANKIESDWSSEDLNNPTVKALIDQLHKILDDAEGANINLFDISDSKNFIRTFIQDIARLKLLLEQVVREIPSKINKINQSIYDINKALLAACEILEGRTIPYAEQIKIDQIDSNFLNGSGQSSDGAATGNKSFRSYANITALFQLLARRIDPVEFFIKAGSSRAEAELDLPPNALYYLIKNYADNGVRGIDAFYMSIGQAKIENLFAMPEFYFQGPEFGLGMPDFSNDMEKLYQYAKAHIDNFRSLIAATTPGILMLDIESFLMFTKVSFNDQFKNFIKTAKSAWQYEENVEKKANNGLEIIEKTLDDVVKNIDKNKLGDGLRNGNNDLLFRMGILNRDLSSLANGNIDSDTDRRLKTIDKNLGLQPGTTRSLILKQRARLAKGEDLLTTDEKKQVEASLDIRVNTLDIYLKLLNGDIKLSELKGEGLEPNYNIANPYAKQDDSASCPINFVLKPGSSTNGDFVINERFLEDDTFCINDQDGRHCFQNESEALRYQAEHSDRKFSNVLDSIARSLSYSIMGGSGREAEFKTLMINLIEGKNVSLSQEEYNNIEQLNFSRADAGEALIPVAIMKKIFGRSEVSSPLMDYKKAVGKVEAGRILQAKLFSALGFRVSSEFFDSGAFYEILNGNFSAIFDIGAQVIEQYIGEVTGTIRAILRAANVNTLNCALSQAGASILGGLVGLDSVSIKGNIIKNIGQARVEQTLGLPKGSFHGKTVYETITYTKPINFILAFKIPMGVANPIEQKSFVPQDKLAVLLGESEANMLKDASDLYKLEKIRNYLESKSTISENQLSAVAAINLNLYLYLPKFLAAYSKGELRSDYSDKQFSPWNEEVKRFRNHIDLLDRSFDINANTTGDLLKGLNGITPDRYIEIVGQKNVIKLAADGLLDMLGLDITYDEGKKVIEDIGAIFKCKKSGIGNECKDERYGNYAPLLNLFSKIFKLNLDEQAGFTPGTFEKIAADPSHAMNILLGQAANTLNQKFGWKEGGFVELYKRYINFVEDNEDNYDLADQNCTDTYSGRWETWQDQKHYYSAIANDKNSAPAQKEDARNNVARINSEISAANSVIEACKRSNRTADRSSDDDFNWKDEAVDILKNDISGQIQFQIRNLNAKGPNGQNINLGINMPLSDIRQMVFEGKIVFLEIAMMAMTVNYVLSSITMGEKNSVPAAMMISYTDIRNAFFPDQATLNAAMNYAAWASMNKEAYDQSRNPYAYGDLCPITGDIFTGLINCTNNQDNALPRTGSALNNGVSTQIAGAYGCVDDKGNYLCNGVGPNYAADQMAELEANRQLMEDAYQRAVSAQKAACNSDPESQSCKDATAALGSANDAFRKSEEDYKSMNDTLIDAKRQVKKMLKETLEYRLADQMLWKDDPNAFPGFTFALMKGSASVKKAALAKYLKNALKNGEIFGIEFAAVKNLDMWLQTVRLVMDKKYSFEDFVNGGGFDQLSSYIKNHFMQWFGFSIDTSIAKGLLLGLSTGHWGQAGNESDVFAVGSHKIPTFLGAVTNWAENRIFSWADKGLGLPTGTTYGWFKAGKAIYETAKMYSSVTALMKQAYWGIYFNEADRVADLAKLNTELSKLLSKDAKIEILKAGGIESPSDAQIDAFDPSKMDWKQKAEAQKQLKQIKKQVIAKAILELATQIILTFVHKWIGNGLSNLESQLGLVQGSLMILVDAAVSYGVAVLAHAIAPGTFGAAGPAGLYIALAVFVLTNLIGVYKVELKCNADGYYWHRENPQPSVVDVSNLGVWDGLNSNTQQTMSIKAAQYKARRLILDVLEMHENPQYADIIPSQIMTGRNQDAEELADSIQTNICSKIGAEVKGGICEGTRAGVWANPQTVAWTHIGF